MRPSRSPVLRIPRTPADARRSHLESELWRRALLWGLRHVPRSVQQASMPLWSLFFYLQVPHVRRAIESNLARLLGTRTRVERQRVAFFTFTNYCRCIANAYSLHAGIDVDIPVKVTGLTHLTSVLSSQRGAILATGHVGNWHLGPYFLAQHGLPPVTVVMHEEPDRGAQEMELELRDKKMRVVYSGQSPLLSLGLRAALKKGELVAFQMDRSSADGGLEVPCAGGHASFALGPAQLARLCDVPVVPVFFPMEGRGVHIVVESPLWASQSGDRQRDHLQLTSELAEVYAWTIRRYPDQWFNFYEFWKP
jgi:KDO2-lipid IV(A) lauroyltransferase